MKRKTTTPRTGRSSPTLLEHLKAVASDRLDSYLADQPARLAEVRRRSREHTTQDRR